RVLLLLGGKEMHLYGVKYVSNFADFVSNLFAGAPVFFDRSLAVLSFSLPVAVIVIAAMVVIIKERTDLGKKYGFVKNKSKNASIKTGKNSKRIDEYNALSELTAVIAAPVVIAFAGALFCRGNAAFAALNLTAVITLMTYIKNGEPRISAFMSGADSKAKKLSVLIIIAVIYMASYTFYFCRGNYLYGYITEYLV
ncbi:MAG: hypothetical protein ACI4RB_03710, partial [Acutalibacteraceae bacterium]